MLYWAVNKHCPAAFEELFHPIEDVTVSNQSVKRFKTGVSKDRICWFYPRQTCTSLPKEEFRNRIYSAYRKILAALISRVDASPVDTENRLGLAHRRFLPAGSSGIHSVSTDYLLHVTKAVQSLGATSAHIACDNAEDKERLSQHLQELDVVPLINPCDLMLHDFDRSKASVVGMGDDLLSLSQCSLGILSNSTRSTVPDSLRGFGIKIYYTCKNDQPFRKNGQDDIFDYHQLG